MPDAVKYNIFIYLRDRRLISVFIELCLVLHIEQILGTARINTS